MKRDSCHSRERRRKWRDIANQTLSLVNESYIWSTRSKISSGPSGFLPFLKRNPVSRRNVATVRFCKPGTCWNFTFPYVSIFNFMLRQRRASGWVQILVEGSEKTHETPPTCRLSLKWSHPGITSRPNPFTSGSESQLVYIQISTRMSKPLILKSHNSQKF